MPPAPEAERFHAPRHIPARIHLGLGGLQQPDLHMEGLGSGDTSDPLLESRLC